MTSLVTVSFSVNTKNVKREETKEKQQLNLT